MWGQRERKSATGERGLGRECGVCPVPDADSSASTCRSWPGKPLRQQQLCLCNSVAATKWHTKSHKLGRPLRQGLDSPSPAPERKRDCWHLLWANNRSGQIEWRLSLAIYRHRKLDKLHKSQNQQRANSLALRSGHCLNSGSRGRDRAGPRGQCSPFVVAKMKISV